MNKRGYSNFVKNAGDMEIKGIKFKKLGTGHYKFDKSPASGEIHFSFDGQDPVEVDKVYASAFGFSGEFRRV